MAMSVYVVFGLLLVGIGQISAVSDEEMATMIAALHASCVEETGVEEKTINDCADGIFAEDTKLKCYMMCLMTTVSLMDEGEIDIDVAISLLPDEYKDTAIPILKECGTVKGVDDCDTAFQTNKCWQAKAPGQYRLL